MIVVTLDKIEEHVQQDYSLIAYIDCSGKYSGVDMTIKADNFAECAGFLREVDSVKKNNDILVVVDNDTIKESISSQILNNRTHVRMVSTVDVVPLTLIDNKIHVGLRVRAGYPYKGELALPGQFIHLDTDKTSDDTVSRIKDMYFTNNTYCEQVQTVAGAGRDIRGPNGWAMSVVYMALISSDYIEDIENKGIKFYPVDDLPNIAFDHVDLISVAVRRFRDKSSYSNLPMFIMSEDFSISELIHVYELVVERKFDQSSFRRKIRERELLREVGRGKGKGCPVLMRMQTGAILFDRNIV